MSKRDELAAVMGTHRGIHCGTYATCLCGVLIADMDSHPMGDYAADHERHIADAVLAWLDGQFDEGLREASDLAVQDYETEFSSLDDTAVSGYTATVLGVVRAWLGLDATDE